jgi:hypothetical protein
MCRFGFTLAAALTFTTFGFFGPAFQNAAAAPAKQHHQPAASHHPTVRQQPRIQRSFQQPRIRQQRITQQPRFQQRTVRKPTVTTQPRLQQRTVQQSKIGTKGKFGQSTIRNANSAKIAGRNYSIWRGSHRVRRHGRWRTFVGLGALSAILFGSAYYYPYAYIDAPASYCAGLTEDGCQLQWQAVPTLEGDTDFVCVAYCPWQ